MKLTYQQFIGLAMIICAVFFVVNLYSPIWGPYAMMGTLIVIYGIFLVRKRMKQKD